MRRIELARVELFPNAQHAFTLTLLHSSTQHPTPTHPTHTSALMDVDGKQKTIFKAVCTLIHWVLDGCDCYYSRELARAVRAPANVQHI